MGRVGLVALSIAVATLLLVGASYSADWIQLYLENTPIWSLIGFGMALPAVGLFLRHRRAQHSKAR